MGKRRFSLIQHLAIISSIPIVLIMLGASYIIFHFSQIRFQLIETQNRANQIQEIGLTLFAQFDQNFHPEKIPQVLNGISRIKKSAKELALYRSEFRPHQQQIDSWIQQLEVETKKLQAFKNLDTEIDLTSQNYQTPFRQLQHQMHLINTQIKEINLYYVTQVKIQVTFMFIFASLISFLLIKRYSSNLISDLSELEKMFSIAGEVETKNNDSFSSTTEFFNIYQRLVIISNDLFQKKITLIQSARLKASAELTAQIAHEINNPLSIIGGNNIILERRILKNTVDNDFLLRIASENQKMVERMGRIISGIKKSVRDGNQDPFGKSDLHSILNEIELLAKTKLTQTKTIFKIAPFKNFEFECREVQISQVLINLINNSCDAIEFQNERWIQLYINQKQDHFQIIVEDSGNGISKEIADNIFSPFYTTKSNGKGSGIGLNLSRDILKSHHGDLILNHHSKHTQFILSIPYLQPQPQRQAA